MRYTDDDKLFFKEWISTISKEGKIGIPLVRKYGFCNAYQNRFHRLVSLNSAVLLLKNIADPEYAQLMYQRKRENMKRSAALRANGDVPIRRKKSNTNNIADIMSKNPLILVYGDQVAGFETLEQVRAAIEQAHVTLPTIQFRVFEVRERSVKTQVTVNIE